MKYSLYWQGDWAAIEHAVALADVAYYPYRRRRVVGDNVIIVPRAFLGMLERALADKCGVRSDNHTTFLIDVDTFGSGRQRFAIWFHDDRAFIGKPTDMDRMD